MRRRLFTALSFCALLLLLPSCEEMKGLDPNERAEMEGIFAEARALDDAGRYHEALVRYETILSRHPEFMSTRLNAAMAAYDSGQYDKANDHFELLRKFRPNDWFVIRKLIQCNERLGHSDVVAKYRAELDRLRNQKEGSLVLKRYEGVARDYIPIGSMHLIGYEFFEPAKHGRLWYFRLEDKAKGQVSAFILESTPYFDETGRRLFSLTEASYGWLRIWHVGAEGRDYKWTRQMVLDALQGKRQPLVVRPLPADYQAVVIQAPAEAKDLDGPDVEPTDAKGRPLPAPSTEAAPVDSNTRIRK